MEIEKNESKNYNFFENYSSRLARALSIIRAGRTRAAEEMFMRKLTKNKTCLKILAPYLIILLKKLYLEVIKLRSNMKQRNFKVKKLCTETFKTLINVNELSR